MSRHFRVGLCCATALVALSIALPRVVHAAVENAQASINDAKAHIAKGDLRGAEIELRNAVRANPSDPELHVQLAQLYLDAHNLPAAEAEARLARQDKGAPDEVDPLLAQALLQQDKYDELFRDIQPGSRKSSSESQVRLGLGLAHLNLHELNQAEPLLVEAERLDGNAVGPKIGMARFLLTEPDVIGAKKELAAASAIAPDDPEVNRVSALTLAVEGDADGAIAKLSAALAKKPDDIQSLALRADILMSEGKLDDAQPDIAHALKLAPDSPGIDYLDGLLLARQGKLREADDKLTRASVRFNSLPFGYYLQGVVKYQLGQYQQAAASLSRYIARDPTAPNPRRLLAQIDIAQRNYSDAIGVLKPVLDADPSDAASSLILAQAYVASGRRNDAIALYQRVADLRPDDVKLVATSAAFLAGLGQPQGLAELDKLANTAKGATVAGPTLVVADIHAGHIDEAAKEAEALVRQRPNDVMAENLLGLARMAQARYADAATIYQNVIEKDPTLPSTRRSLAAALIALGERDKAKSALEALLKQFPNSIADAITLAGLDAETGDEPAAEDLLKKTQTNATSNPAPGLALINIYSTAKQWDKGEAYGRELEGQFPANPAVVNAVASLRLAAGDSRGAVSEFAALIQASPASPALLVRYAQLQNAAGDKAGARASYQQAVSQAPHNQGAMEALVNFELQADGADAALAAAQSFARNEPETAKILAANVLMESGRAKDAVELLTEEQKTAPSAAIVAKLGEVLYAAGNHDEAEQLLRGWIKDHDDQAPRVTLATVYMSEHRYDDARVLYEALRVERPYDVVVLNNLAEIYARKHDVRALAYASQAYRLDPNPIVADTLGWIMVSYGQASDAVPLLRTAIRSLGTDPSVAYHLAAALSATGQPAEARSLLERAVGSGGAFDEKPEAQQLLQKLQRS